ncbi:MAG: trypsin-like peptidase domain-containing protein [Clostridiales bacterium]|jgi:S1-C subfamily serine protease|nr:trypsin-like peptidase domain-containing protein [Clostridiales bacterium]
MVIIRPLKVKSATAENPVDLFLRESCELNRTSRTVCFYRVIGTDSAVDEYISKIKEIDTAAEKFNYVRLNSLGAPPPDKVPKIAEASEEWIRSVDSDISQITKLSLPFEIKNESLKFRMAISLNQILKIEKNKKSESVLKNFAIKMLFWIAENLKPLFENTKTFPKIVFTGEATNHAGLFLFYCALCGCDVLYIHSQTDFTNTYHELQKFSHLHDAGSRKNAIAIPKYTRKPAPVNPPAPPPADIITSQNIAVVTPRVTRSAAANRSPAPPQISQNRELSYEELAAFSASVVMIAALDNQKNVLHTGSGVVINNNGYILTNFHVISGGTTFGARFENEDEAYYTDTLVKYHHDYDLAIIRVNRPCEPILLPPNNTLTRGQKVVAIGSPLGLFNTVSDGIISAFREINGVDMIQFTAPISSGSSGGALLNMQGKLIGIITSGFNSGQNLNLAVSGKLISDFARTFI